MHTSREQLERLARINKALQSKGMPKIFVEMNLSSNLGTRALDAMAAGGMHRGAMLSLYPLLDMLLLDIPVLVSTDGAGVYNTLREEQKHAMETLERHVEDLMKQSLEPNAGNAKDRLRALWQLTHETAEPPQDMQAHVLATALFERLLKAQQELLQVLGLADGGETNATP